MSHFLQPPWLEFPDLPFAHIGWRMGAGEGYLKEFVSWVTQLEEWKRKEYLEQLRPIPDLWTEFVAQLYIHPSMDEEELDDMEAWFMEEGK